VRQIEPRVVVQIDREAGTERAALWPLALPSPKVAVPRASSAGPAGSAITSGPARVLNAHPELAKTRGTPNRTRLPMPLRRAQSPRRVIASGVAAASLNVPRVPSCYVWAMFWSRFGAVALVGSGLVACSGSDGIVVPLPLDECPDGDYSTCDTRDSDCQQRLLELTACVYGVDAPTELPVRVLTEQELLDDLEGDPSAPPSDTDAEALPYLERALVDLQLLKAGALTTNGGANADLVTRVSGLYRDAERGVVLVDRGEATDSAEADAALVHELVHALQDANFGLDDWRRQQPDNPDTELALGSVTEGQATLVQYRVWAAMTGEDANSVDWESTFLRLRNRLFASARADESPYFAARETFPSGFGVTLANLAWTTDGAAYRDAQFASPPLTTLEILAQNAQQDPPTFAAPPFQTPTVSDDYSAKQDLVLGAFLLGLSAHRLGDDSADPLPLLLAWRGDELLTYAGPNDETAWLWQVQVADAATAQALQSLADAGGMTAEAKRTRLFLLGGDEPPAFLLDAGRAFLDAQR